MSLLDTFFTPCVLMDKTRQPDGEGGFVAVWVDGLEFEAAIVMDSSTAARVAESEGMKSIYTVTTNKNLRLDFHDVFKRVSDGKYFRVTSDATDKQTPEVATFQFEQVQAEEWTLTNGN